jgi:phosphonate transport system substrate-binding protein
MKLYRRAWAVAGLGVATLLTACGTPASTGSAEAPDVQEIRMAFVPSQQAQVVLDNANKLAELLSTKTGYKVSSKVSTSYAAVTAALTAKNAEVGWTGPLDYVIAHERNGAIPLTKSVRRGKAGYKAFMICNTDSGVKTIKDLKGHAFAFGDVNSTSSSLYPKFFMKQNGIDPEKDLSKTVQIASQTVVAVSVYKKQVDCGAIYDDARLNKGGKDVYPDILEKTRVILEMPGPGPDDLIPGDPQMIRKDINSKQREKIRQALIDLANDPEGAKYLMQLYTIEKLVKADDKDYQQIRDVVKQVQPEILKETPSPSASK